MASKVDTTDEESFIVLGTSPGPSLEMNGVDRFYGDASLDHAQLDDALKDLSAEASMAFKAHFKLGDGPSPASLMAASTIITDDRSTEELQKHFGELLDENVILKETLKQKNDSMKEQFLLIASCQEDMMKTHMVHKEKFDETRELVEKLRQENKKLKSDIARLAESDGQPVQPDSETGENGKSGPSSALEFVMSPDEDTIYKLTAQLELVEKQRRQVIVDNEKLTWQKESLEHIADATSKERDDLKEKIKNLELQLSSIESEYVLKINDLNSTIQELRNKLQVANDCRVPPEEVTNRDALIQQLENKVTTLQGSLKTAQLKILDLENVKLEFTKQKSGVSDFVKIYKDQIQELQDRLKEAQTTVFQPVRFSISPEPESTSSEYSKFINNVKLYDKTLKHLADLLNLVTHGASDSLVETLGLVVSLYDFKLDRTTVDQFKAGLAEVKRQLEKQHSVALGNIGQVRSILTIFEGIFKDYNELLKNALSNQENKPVSVPNVEALTAALLARSQEIESLNTELHQLRITKDDTDLLSAQVELYKSDFEAERQAREKMASEKETILTDLRQTQKRNQELLMQLEEVRKLNPNIYRSATAKRAAQNGPGQVLGPPGGSGTPRRSSGPPSGNAATGNMLEFTKQKSGVSDFVKIYKDQIQELQDRLKEAQTTVFQPVRFSISPEPESTSSEYSKFINNVKLYDKTLKHLADLLNLVTHGASDSLVETLGLVVSLYDFKLDRTTVDQFKAGLAEVKRQLEKQHSVALGNIGQVRSILTIFEGIFKDYNELLKNALSNQENKPVSVPNVEALTAALLARSQEIESLNTELHQLRITKDDTDLLSAQVELYKSDFEAERQAREKMASEKETILTDLRQTQKRNQELLMQLEEVRKLNPNIYRSATAKRAAQNGPGQVLGPPGGSGTPRRSSGPPSGNAATGNMGYARAGPRNNYEINDDCIIM